MFTVQQKREISDKIQTILRDTRHPELPDGEIVFHIHVRGKKNSSFDDIVNRSAIKDTEAA